MSAFEKTCTPSRSRGLLRETHFLFQRGKCETHEGLVLSVSWFGSLTAQREQIAGPYRPCGRFLTRWSIQIHSTDGFLYLLRVSWARLVLEGFRHRSWEETPYVPLISGVISGWTKLLVTAAFWGVYRGRSKVSSSIYVVPFSRGTRCLGIISSTIRCFYQYWLAYTHRRMTLSLAVRTRLQRKCHHLSPLRDSMAGSLCPGQ